MGTLRTMLVLGRVSNLPTVWSNCLAGWTLAGAKDPQFLIPLVAGASLLYVGGMFLNDACDVEFDRQFCPERPIPSGLISRRAVMSAGFGLLAGGVGLCWLGGLLPGALAVLLALTIILYDLVHKRVSWSPVIMAACRFLLYLLAGAGALSGLLTAAAASLAGYITGISALARGERSGLPGGNLFAVALLAPVLFALLTRPPAVALLYAAPLLALIAAAVHMKTRSVPASVGLLLAGIPLVDLLIVAPASVPLGLVFLALFGTTILLQRYIPAT